MTPLQSQALFAFFSRYGLSSDYINGKCHVTKSNGIVRAYIDLPSKIGLQETFRHSIRIDREGNYKIKIK
jgi:hypothetical protein